MISRPNCIVHYAFELTQSSGFLHVKSQQIGAVLLFVVLIFQANGLKKTTETANPCAVVRKLNTLSPGHYSWFYFTIRNLKLLRLNRQPNNIPKTPAASGNFSANWQFTALKLRHWLIWNAEAEADKATRDTQRTINNRVSTNSSHIIVWLDFRSRLWCTQLPAETVHRTNLLVRHVSMVLCPKAQRDEDKRQAAAESSRCLSSIEYEQLQTSNETQEEQACHVKCSTFSMLRK